MTPISLKQCAKAVGVSALVYEITLWEMFTSWQACWENWDILFPASSAQKQKSRNQPQQKQSRSRVTNHNKNKTGAFSYLRGSISFYY